MLLMQCAAPQTVLDWSLIEGSSALLEIRLQAPSADSFETDEQLLP